VPGDKFYFTGQGASAVIVVGIDKITNEDGSKGTRIALRSFSINYRVQTPQNEYQQAIGEMITAEVTRRMLAIKDFDTRDVMTKIPFGLRWPFILLQTRILPLASDVFIEKTGVSICFSLGHYGINPPGENAPFRSQ